MTIKLTREEAIQDLKAIKSFERYARGRLALDIAIEALKREPNEDGTLEVKVEDATKIGRVLIADDKHRGGLYYPDEDEPQGDLISRAEAIEAIELVDWYHQNKNKDMIHGANDDEHQAWYKAQDIYKALEAVPSADRSRGEWVEQEDDYHHYWECSECGMGVGLDDIRNFCPNCGSDMRPTERSEE